MLRTSCTILPAPITSMLHCLFLMCNTFPIQLFLNTFPPTLSSLVSDCWFWWCVIPQCSTCHSRNSCVLQPHQQGSFIPCVFPAEPIRFCFRRMGLWLRVGLFTEMVITLSWFLSQLACARSILMVCIVWLTRVCLSVCVMNKILYLPVHMLRCMLAR